MSSLFNHARRPSCPAGILVLLATSVLLADSAQGQSNRLNPSLHNRWEFWAGGFFPDMSTDIRLDSAEFDSGTSFNLEDELGLNDSKSVLWGGFRWRISRRNQLEAEISNLNNSGFVAFRTRPLNIDDFTVTAQADIATEWDLKIVRFTYAYSMISRERHDLSIKAGIHLAATELDILATGDIRDEDTGMTVCSPSPPCSVGVTTDDFTFPLPHAGLSYDFAFNSKWSLSTAIMGFAIKINDIRASLIETQLDLRYQPWKRFGFGAGYRHFRLSIEDLDNSFLGGKFAFNYDGPVLFLIATF